MKLDILQRKKQQRLEEMQMQSNLKRYYEPDEHIYQIASQLKLYNPIELTNEWIINHQGNNIKTNDHLTPTNTI